MNLSNIRKQVVSLQQQRRQLVLKLIRFRSEMVRGSLVHAYKKCDRENCAKCSNGLKHGPFLYLNLKIDGRATSRYVGKESDMPIVKRARAYMNYQDTLAQVRKITSQIDSLFNLYRDQLTIDPRTPMTKIKRQ